MAEHSLQPAPVPASRLRWLALAASLSTFLLIVIGGIVRVTGSGLACPDWPLCHGQLIPPLTGPVLIEWSHRLMASVTSPLILATAWLAWRRCRRSAWIWKPAATAVLLLAVQVLLGALSVLLELPPAIVAVHLANALIILGLLLITTVTAFRLARNPAAAERQPVPDAFAWRAALAAFGVLALMVSGSLVTASGSGWACGGWPDCGDGAWFPPTGLAAVHMLHRFVAGLVGVGVVAVAVRAVRQRREDTPLVVSAVLTLALFVAQVLVGAANVRRGFPTFLNGLHLATAAAVWAAVVVLAVLAFQWVRPAAQAMPVAPAPRPDRRPIPAWADYLALTKPLIAALLLVTTYCAMVVAGGALPPAGLTFWTLLGGALAAGGASALNQVIDADLDRVMTRTAQRPLAAGRVERAAALSFGLVLCVASFYVLALMVNPASALWALVGILYYVIGYTLLLKRATVQNIVIGGGAGAIPPLVGWAAVSGGLSVPALFLFAIVFFWTPPHFWALALLKRQDYARARVPMLPVVWGEAETRRQIFLYTLLVVALSLLLAPANVAGLLFLACAAALGIGLIAAAAWLLAGGGNRAAWRMYRYSSVYLALLFVALAVDRVLWS